MKKISRLTNLLSPAASKLLGLLLFAAPGAIIQAESSYVTPYSFVTLAGTDGGPGDTDGTGTAARLNAPHGTAMDAAGNIYVADSENHTIRKITPAGVVSTLAGKPGASGEVDGVGSAARFDEPRFVAVDTNGNVFVTEEFSYVIRKITPDGRVSLFAGDAATPGDFDGTGPTARFGQPRGLAVDSTGNVYVADRAFNTIRKISPQGNVSTFAGTPRIMGSTDGIGPAALFKAPEGLAIDNAGNLYVADIGNQVIRKVTVDGTVTTFAGTAGGIGTADGTGPAAQFSAPLNLAADASGNIFVGEGFKLIRKITPSAVVTTYAEISVSGPGYHSNGIMGLTVDKTGVVYASIPDDHLIYKISSTGIPTPWVGSANLAGNTNASGTNARFNNPTGVAVDSAGNCYVADQFNHIIRKISASGVVTTFAGTANAPGSADGVGADARFSNPAGVALDASGNLYVADGGNGSIRKITPTGVVTTVAGAADRRGTIDGDVSTASFLRPISVAIDKVGTIYVADYRSARKITPSGTVSTLEGASDSIPVFPYYDPDPVGVAVDQAGNVYVANYKQCIIRKITPDGTATTLAGTTGEAGSDDGQGASARFAHPYGLAVDSLGNIYVADQGNCTIRKITPQGAVTTLAGAVGSGTLVIDGRAFTPGGLIGSADGTGASARFYHPSGIAVDGSGNLYVANTDNNNIRKGRLASAPIITTQPASQSAAAGGSAQFSVTAGGMPEPAYQWYFNDTPFNGATGKTLSLTNLRASDAGNYTVTVTNAVGTVTSSKATLTVTSAQNQPSDSSGSGGGAMSDFFLLALATLSLARAVRPKGQYQCPPGHPM